MSIFYPDLMVNSIDKVTSEILYSLNIKNVLLDIDDTISPNKEIIISESIQKWICSIKQNSIKAIIISNNSKERAEYFASKLDIPYIYRAMKPLPFGIKRAMKLISGKKNNTAIIGDQIFTDVLGAKICGIKSILVEPLSKDGNMLIRFKRYIEFYIKNRIKSSIFI